MAVTNFVFVMSKHHSCLIKSCLMSVKFSTFCKETSVLLFSIKTLLLVNSCLFGGCVLAAVASNHTDLNFIKEKKNLISLNPSYNTILYVVFQSFSVLCLLYLFSPLQHLFIFFISLVISLHLLSPP